MCTPKQAISIQMTLSDAWHVVVVGYLDSLLDEIAADVLSRLF